MSLTDPIADILTRLRNASRAQKETVEIKGSKLNQSVMAILKKEGYIDNFRFMEDNKQGIVKVYLKFDSDKRSAITGLRRISKPGRRIYVDKDKVPYVLNGLGIAILSTSKGIFTDKEARKLGIGGEVLCYIW